MYTLGRVRPFYFELSLEPFKYNDESLDTGIDAIDMIEVLESYKTMLDVEAGSGDYVIGEIIYQGTANNKVAYGEVTAWDSANSIVTIINDSGEFSNTAGYIYGANSNAQRLLTTVDNRIHETQFDNLPIFNEVIEFLDPSNGFGSLKY